MQRFSEFTEEKGHGTYPVHAVHTLEKGAWGSQEYKQVHWTYHHTKNPNFTQVDTKHGPHSMHPNGVHKILNDHPHVKELKKQGWHSSEYGGGLATDKAHLSDIHKRYNDNDKRKVEVIKGEDTHWKT